MLKFMIYKIVTFFFYSSCLRLIDMPAPFLFIFLNFDQDQQASLRFYYDYNFS